jgi:hypothetical protein
VREEAAMDGMGLKEFKGNLKGRIVAIMGHHI